MNNVPRLVATLALLSLSINTFAAESPPASHATLLDTYCAGCHNDDQWAGSMSLSVVSTDDLQRGANLDRWEKILRRTNGGEMPPEGEPRPAADEMAAFTGWLETSLDNYAAGNPDPGRATLRRLNRTEYTNAVRDLLALNVDVSKELPADDAGYGFDNIADVLSVTPTLMDRYLAVAGKISRLALGLAPELPSLTSYTIPKDGSIMNQGIPSYDERASDELPFDSRGGGAFSYYAPHEGTYVISGYLNANTNNEVDRLKETRVSLRVPLSAGSHTIGMAFRRELALDESVQTLHNTTDVVVLPLDAPEALTLDWIVDGSRVGTETVPSYHKSDRFSQKNFLRDVLQIDVEGPYDVSGPGATASRAKVLLCKPGATAATETACASQIITTLARQAFRRPVDQQDIAPLLKVYSSERSETDFEQGVAAAVQAILVSPSFLFFHEQDPEGSAPGFVHPVSDGEFASRLALFLWSSLPDEQLLTLAANGTLREPAVLQQQVARMLDDPRADALTDNFASQWLYLRNLEFQRPDVFLFPQFSTRLQQAMRRETELFFSHILRENRSVLDFINADYTFLNQALAEHYGISDVKGAAFRKVALDPAANRGGLLGQASILTVTSYGNHTSVVKRGKWILDNLLSAPPPAPPPDVPALVTSVEGRKLNAREQMELHRQNPICASCHVRMDPLGYALEHFDAVGAWRSDDAGRPVDDSAVMSDGTRFNGLGGVQQVLMERKDQFVRALTERLLTYAIGRGMEAHDQPTVRSIARTVKADDYRMQTLVMAIITSEPFNLRKTPGI